MFNNSQLNLAVFFDDSLDDLKNLSKGVFVKNLYPLKKHSNPFHFIQKVISNKKGKGEIINDIHIIAHGNNEAIFFGNYKFDLDELKKAKINLENLNLKKIVL